MSFCRAGAGHLRGPSKALHFAARCPWVRRCRSGPGMAAGATELMTKGRRVRRARCRWPAVLVATATGLLVLVLPAPSFAGRTPGGSADGVLGSTISKRSAIPCQELCATPFMAHVASSLIPNSTRQANDDSPAFTDPEPPPKGFVHLDLWPHGRGTIKATTDNADPGESANPVHCGLETGGSCTGTYLPGRVVRLEARPDSTERLSTFEAWSDNRCPTGPVCEIRVDADPVSQSVAALFSPQPVIVFMQPSSDRSTVTSVPPGMMCEGSPDPAENVSCIAEFPLFSEVSLVAEGTEPVWGPDCDSAVGATCHLSVKMARPVNVGFHGIDPGHWGGGGNLGVYFYVVKAGTGEGRVHSRLIDCGSRCTTSGLFGKPLTLTAAPDAGSRFVGWKGGCGRAPRCELFMGPVTRVVAVFDTAAPPRTRDAPLGKKGGGRGGNAGGGSGKGEGRPFKANFGDIEIRRVRGRRVIHFSIGVSSRATVRARLGRKSRTVASRTWQVGSGAHRLRLRLAPKARNGLYRLRVSARGQAGTTRVFTRRLRW
jgi:hypothetical protein